jgi:hypothetical protein
LHALQCNAGWKRWVQQCNEEHQLQHDFGAGAGLGGMEVLIAGAGRHERPASLSQNTPMVTRGIALADVDGDGQLDFALANQWAPFLFCNTAPVAGAFLGLHLRLPVGAWSSDKTVVRKGHPRLRATRTSGSQGGGDGNAASLPHREGATKRIFPANHQFTLPYRRALS